MIGYVIYGSMLSMVVYYKVDKYKEACKCDHIYLYTLHLYKNLFLLHIKLVKLVHIFKYIPICNLIRSK